MQGNRRTLNMGTFFYHNEPFNLKFGPVIRIIHDLGVEDKVWGCMDTGIEQRPLSEHRTDFMDMFHKGEYLEMPTGREVQSKDGKKYEKFEIKKKQ